ncbi:unnamed protein product [Linum tenue]|uniref:DNA helicase Pif1-like 2B domain-containing protein n=1 Tax=Linum tenue TaxID=586396 RepID=A0AAV0IQU7_9ROSI|nr:unnamed protein product [Linum tenue]
MGSLLPPPGQPPKFSQLYVFDPRSELQDRLANFSSGDKHLKPEVIAGLTDMLDTNNILVKTFRRVRQELHDPATSNLRLRIVGARDNSSRQYDLPTGTEIAGLIPGDFVADKEDRDIIIDHCVEGLKRITSLNPKFEALHFPLLFPYGEDGFHTNIPYHHENTDQPHDWIPIPPVCLLPPSSEPTSTICDHIYTDFSRSYHQASYLTARAIVTPTNKNVTEINDHMLERVRGKTHSYFSADAIHSDSKDCQRLEDEYPPEFLNTLSFSGFPDHEIGLKIFAPVMLLRNLNPEIGLCNGTRIMVTYLTTYVIKGLIMGGAYAGSVVAIPRIVVNIDNRNWPFILKRRQFPVRLCYAMTINKSQGQTLDRVGVFLPKPVFSHGQLYVAVSRVRSAEGLKFLIENEDHIPAGYTRNIVYNETFDSLGGSSCSIPLHATRFVQ